MTRGAQTPSVPSSPPVEGVPTTGEIVAQKYEVERVLGVGGMGVVVAARHIALGQRVAIKFMRVEAAQHVNGVDRFLREARAVVALSSEHVAKVLDVGTLESGAPYMVMEYLAGADLGEVLKTRGPLPVAETVSAVLQACEAIAEAHVLGIVHRDLKPSNLFATTRRDGSPLIKVLDFGISKTVDLNTQGGRQSLTASGLLIGSPLYMSPEQLRSAKAADARSDVWSLGVILFELLTGQAPFGADTLGETLARIIAEPAPPVRDRRPDIPEGLAAVISQCLERDVQRRVQSIADLANKLAPFAPRDALVSVERIARVSGSSAAPPAQDTRTAVPSPSPYGSWGPAPSTLAADLQTEPAWLKSGGGSSDFKIVRRRRFVPYVVGAGVVLLIAGGVGVLQYRGRGEATGAPAIASPQAIATPPAQAATAAPPPAEKPRASSEWTPLAPSETPRPSSGTATELAPLAETSPRTAEVARPDPPRAGAQAPRAAVEAPDAGAASSAAERPAASRPTAKPHKPAKPQAAGNPSSTAAPPAATSEDELLLQRQ